MKPLNKFTLILVAFAINFNLSAQIDQLIGGVENKLIKINQNTGSYVNYMTINNFPPGKFINKLSWCAENNCFYTLATQSGTIDNKVSIINANGNYVLKGTVTIAGGTVYHIENIFYDALSNSIYAAASLNGTMNTSDYESESLIKIDTATMQATLVGVAMHSGTSKEPEFDNITIGIDGYLYYTETQGGFNSFNHIYKQDLTFTNPPILVYSESINTSVGDITIRNNYLYFVANRELRKINLSNYFHSTVGTIFTSIDFNGSQMYGLDWKNSYVASTEELANSETHEIIAFPNPTNGTLNFDSKNQLIEKIEIYDLNGRLLLQKELNKINPSIEILELNNGFYFIKSYLSNGKIADNRVEILRN
jgi:hypothetical protein